MVIGVLSFILLGFVPHGPGVERLSREMSPSSVDAAFVSDLRHGKIGLYMRSHSTGC